MRKLVCALIGLLLILPIGVLGCGKEEVETITWRMAHGYPATSIVGRQAQLLADLVYEKTDGRLKIDVYPSGQLFSEPAGIEAVATGGIEMLGVSPYFMFGTLPYLRVMFLEGMWEGYEHAYRFITNEDVIDMVRTTLDGQNMYFLGFVPSSMQTIHVTKNKELETKWDMNGLRIGSRGMGEPPSNLLVGLVPVEIDEAEMLTAFSTGITDIYGGTLGTVSVQNVWEYGAKHGFISKGSCLARTFVVNKDIWNGLAADIRDIILNDVFPEVIEGSQEMMEEAEGAAITLFQSKLDTVHQETDADVVALWEQLKEYDAAQAWLASAGEELLQIIEDIRPSND